VIELYDENSFAHYGTPRHSGRYPWGSGGEETTRNRDYLQSVKKLKKDGMTESQIATGQGISVKELRARVSIASAQVRQANILTAQRHAENGWSNSEIGRRMGVNESTVRSWLAPGAKDKAVALQSTSGMLKDQVAKKGYVDVGKGVEHQLGITKTRLETSLAVLKEQGYPVHTLKIRQVNNPGQFTTMQVLAKPGTSLAEVNANRKDIKQITARSDDYGRSYHDTQPPLSISSRRVGIVYGKEGAKADGMIYVRPGVPDVQIGNKRYGQVRIAVDGTHYLKGMAVYKDDLPAGKDLVFHTKQPDTGRKKDAMKELEKDPELPFGSIVRQTHDSNGKVNSVMNLVGSPTKPGSGEEGQWDTWSRNLSSQFLSKQKPELAKQQLDLTFERRKRELSEINSLTNPLVKKDLLNKFADQTDSAAVHLRAAALPRQATKVLIPIPSMSPKEVYAPSFRDGERVVLVRYPHGGTFEIPEVTVNNRNREAIKLLGRQPQDAIGIHHKVAERLSGADFDGDTVLVIPNRGKKVQSTPPLEGLKNFDPMVYKLPKDSPIPRMTGRRKQDEMGRVSNLITDMTLKGASTDELARAIKHSMVVIDGEKHNLDFRQSEKDHGIHALKQKYQGGKQAGAQTLISRKKSPVWLNERRPRPMRRGGPVDPVTGKKVFEETGRLIPDVKTRTRKDPVTGEKITVKEATGRMKKRQKKHELLSVVDNAYDAIPPTHTPTAMEILYAEHSNRLKAMANDARKTSLPLKGNPQSKSAKKHYAAEVKSLDAKIREAERNAPYERHAHLLANVEVYHRRQANPDMEPEEYKKVKQQALTRARNRTGASKTKIKLTQSEWDAIQAGAISNHKLSKILNNTDMDTVKVLAMPKHKPKLTGTMLRRAKSMANRGYTQAEIADALGIGLTTLKVGLSE